MKKKVKELHGTGFATPSIGKIVPRDAKLVRMKNGRIKFVKKDKKQ